MLEFVKIKCFFASVCEFFTRVQVLEGYYCYYDLLLHVFAEFII
jgi:hypothetical protein